MGRPLAAGAAVLLAGALAVPGVFGQSFSNNIKYSGGGAPVLNGHRFEIEAGAGQRAGGNLFHSFSDFSLAKDHAAVFKTPGGVGNILARVVGGNASEIDGTLRTELEAGGGLSGANLFLINPSGIVFGPNAKLEVGGAFTATTADHLKLSDGGRFDARNPSADVLTTAPVSAFGFVSASPAGVTFQGSRLEAASGTGLHVVGGAVKLEGAQLKAPGGRLTLQSRAGAGELAAEPPVLLPGQALDVAGLGDVELKGGSVASIDGNGGGRLVIRAGRLVMEGASSVSSRNSGAVAGGGVEVVARTVGLFGGSRIESAALGPGDGGAISIYASEGVEVDGDDGAGVQSSLRTSAAEGVTGSGGALSVESAGTLRLTNGGDLGSENRSAAQGGAVSVKAAEAEISGRAAVSAAAIFSQATGTGEGGDLLVEVGGGLRLWASGRLFTGTYGPGKGGDVSLRAGSLTLEDSGAAGEFTAIFSETASPLAGAGEGGGLDVRVAGAVSLSGNGTIEVGSFSSGQGGSLHLEADSLLVDGGATPEGVPSIYAQSAFGGDSGHLELRVSGAVTLRGGGAIIADTYSAGRGGDVDLRAGSLLVDGTLAQGRSTGVFARTYGEGAGEGGSLGLEVAGAVEITAGGEVLANSYSTANGGSLLLRAGSLSIDGTAAEAGSFTGIYAESRFGGAGGGDAGAAQIAIQDQVVLRGGGQISASTFSTGKGGALRLEAGSLSIDGGDRPEVLTGIAATTQFAGEGAGDAGSLDLSIDGPVSLSAGGQIFSGSFSTGNAGRLKLHARSLFIDGFRTPEKSTGIASTSQSAGPGAGAAGSVILDVDGPVWVFDGGQISTSTFSTGNGGRLVLRARKVTIDGQFTPGVATGITATTESSLADGGDAGSLTLRVGGRLRLGGGGQISASTSSGGDGGGLNMRAGSLVIDGSNLPDHFPGIFSQAASHGDFAGNGGDMDIRVLGAVKLRGRGQISVSTSSRGRGGSLYLEAGRLLIDGSATPGLFTGVTAQTTFPGPGAGDSGDLRMRIGGEVRILSGGEISVATFSEGRGGSLALWADSLRLDGVDRFGNVTGIFGQTVQAGAGAGDAGQVKLFINGAVSVLRGAEISMSSASRGRGGSLKMSAGSLLIDGAALEDNFTGIGATAQFDGPGAGDGGDVDLAVRGAVTVRGGGQITAGTLSTGHGGSVQLRAGSLSIDGRDTADVTTGIFATTEFPGPGAGDGGNLSVSVDGLATIAGGGQISASTLSGGRGGNVEVSAASLRIDGSEVPSPLPGQAPGLTGIVATAELGSTGDGGSVRVKACDLEISGGGEISAASYGPGEAGDVRLEICGAVVLKQRSRISSAADLGRAGRVELLADGPVSLFGSAIGVQALVGDAGDIVVRTPGRLTLEDSGIVAVAGQNGGNVTVGAGFLRLGGRSLISANAVNGDGGRIVLEIPADGVFGDARDFVVASPFIAQSSESRISASSTFGVAGTLLIDAPFVDLAGSLESLEGGLFDASTQLRDQCARKLQRDFSSYLRLGRGGQEAQPDEFWAGF